MNRFILTSAAGVLALGSQAASAIGVTVPGIGTTLPVLPASVPLALPAVPAGVANALPNLNEVEGLNYEKLPVSVTSPELPAAVPAKVPVDIGRHRGEISVKGGTGGPGWVVKPTAVRVDGVETPVAAVPPPPPLPSLPDLPGLAHR